MVRYVPIETLVVTSAKAVEASVTAANNSFFFRSTHSNEHTQPIYDRLVGSTHLQWRS